jgi:hypothetical protein
VSNPPAGKGNSLGLTIGATNFTGAGVGQRAVIRPATVTLERGVTLTGFVDRVGDPIPMVAQDEVTERPTTTMVRFILLPRFANCLRQRDR